MHLGIYVIIAREVPMVAKAKDGKFGNFSYGFTTEIDNESSIVSEWGLVGER